MKETSTVALIFAFLLRLAGCTETGPAATLEFAFEFERAEAEGRIRPGEDRDELLARTLSVVDKRVRQLGIRYRYRDLDEHGFKLDVWDGSDPVVQSVIEIVTMSGELEFRITVRPREEYEPLPDGEMPARLKSAATSPWPGTAAAFREYKEREVERWQAAREAHEVYRPSRAAYRLCLHAGAEGTQIEQFELVEEPAEARHRLGGEMLQDPVVGVGAAGQPEIYYNVRPAFTEALGAFTERNVGMPLAIILNDHVHSAPVIQGRLTDRVRISLGYEHDHAETEAEAKRLGMVLQAGALRLRPTLVSVRRRAK